MNAPAREGTSRLTPADPRWWFGGRWVVPIRHPVARLVRDLVPGSADTTAVCPHCPVERSVVAVLDHLLGDHGSGRQAAAEWLETVDGDLFALAVHHLMCGTGTTQSSIAG